MTTYLGTDLLDIQPTSPDDMGSAHELAANLLDSRTGPRSLDVLYPRPASVRTLPFLAMDLGEAYELRRFLLARRGRQRAFWCPSWQRDFVLSATAGSGSATVTVVGWGYTADLWPVGAARRHVWLRSPAGTAFPRRVTAAVDNGNGTETLTLLGPGGETSLGVAADSTWLVSFLRFSRLDQDENYFDWDGPVASLTLPVRELPGECPA